MSCQCEIYEICSQCAPSSEAFLKAVRDHDEVVSRQPQSSPSSPSYTLAELTDLANRYADEIDDDDLRLTVRLNLSGLLTWLAKKEREANDVAETSAN